MKKILVTGATGKQGGSVVDALLECSFDVRAMTRNGKSEKARRLSDKGVTVVEAQFDDIESLSDAMHDRECLFSVQNYWQKGVGYEGEIRQASNLIKAAQRNGINHFVQSSMAAAPNVDGVRHFESKREIEKLIQESEIPYTFVGTTYFMENVLDDDMGGKMTFPTLAGTLKKHTRIHLLSYPDIGRVVREILLRPADFVGERANIAGDFLTVSEMKQVYRETTGLSPKWYSVPRFMLRWMAKEFSEQLDWHNATNFSFSMEDTRQTFPFLTTFKSFLKNNEVSGL